MITYNMYICSHCNTEWEQNENDEVIECPKCFNKMEPVTSNGARYIYDSQQEYDRSVNNEYI